MTIENLRYILARDIQTLYDNINPMRNNIIQMGTRGKYGMTFKKLAQSYNIILNGAKPLFPDDETIQMLKRMPFDEDDYYHVYENQYDLLQNIDFLYNHIITEGLAQKNMELVKELDDARKQLASYKTIK